MATKVIIFSCTPLTTDRFHLVRCYFPDNRISDALEKLCSPPMKASVVEHLSFTHTFNPKIPPDLQLIGKCLDDLESPEMRNAFSNTKPLCATRQPKNTLKMLVQGRFSLAPSLVPPIPILGHPLCGICKLCILGFIIPATEVVLRRGNRWTYRRLFTCNSIGIWLVPVFIQCDVICRPETTNHLYNCFGLVEPYFAFYSLC